MKVTTVRTHDLRHEGGSKPLEVLQRAIARYDDPDTVRINTSTNPTPRPLQIRDTWLMHDAMTKNYVILCVPRHGVEASEYIGDNTLMALEVNGITLIYGIIYHGELGERVLVGAMFREDLPTSNAPMEKLLLTRVISNGMTGRGLFFHLDIEENQDNLRRRAIIRIGSMQRGQPKIDFGLFVDLAFHDLHK